MAGGKERQNAWKLGLGSLERRILHLQAGFKDPYLSTVQVVTLYGMSLVCVLQSPLGSSLTCRVKYLRGEEPEPPVTQWR